MQRQISGTLSEVEITYRGEQYIFTDVPWRGWYEYEPARPYLPNGDPGYPAEFDGGAECESYPAELAAEAIEQDAEHYSRLRMLWRKLRGYYDGRELLGIIDGEVNERVLDDPDLFDYVEEPDYE